ncbi:uncharacterized protein LOC131228000 [Magnolia sinica]|uniref:uncharacterized protein LOC131228000 n=1 Tax=Magnolia sinica TaxID=86752 RepID=UPI002659FBFE|nr:uncharacterized protein LOC131228000 [Magnolia sinica]
MEGGYGWTEEEMVVFGTALAAATTTIAVGEYCINYLFRTSSRFGDYERSRIINWIIREGEQVCVAQLRMNKATFFNLCSLLRDRNMLPDGKHIYMEEQLVIFLHTVGHNVRNRVIENQFIRLGETVSRYFTKALDAVVGLYPNFVKLPSAETPPEILSNPKWSTYFQDCIGAIDGIHVPAYVPALESATYRNRKGILSQNVMVACTFDMKFVYVLAGWEGSVSDARILHSTLTHTTDRFTIPQGKYHIVDAGYAHLPGFMASYRGVQYHLNEYHTGRNPTNKKELFNYQHTQLRNVIERIFGVLKARFSILKSAPPYNLNTQVKIVIACCMLHNFIRIFGGDSLMEEEVTSTEVTESVDLSPCEGNATQREKDE